MADFNLFQANRLEKAQALYTDYLKKLDAVLAPPYPVNILNYYYYSY